MSNRDAMEALKKELSQADPHRISSVKLVSNKWESKLLSGLCIRQ